MATLTLPLLVAGRDLAAFAVAQLGAIAGSEVVVDARPLASGTASFAAQLVDSTLGEGRAARVVLIGGPAEFVDDVRAAADTMQVADRIDYLDANSSLPVAS